MARIRSQVFGEVADDYDAARPSYPAAVVDLVVAGGPVTALDVGCGTGKAATLVAARGVSVLGLEPDERMAEVARRHGLEVVVTRLEDWPAQPHDVVYSAQAWHWVDPERGAAKAGEVLAPGGRWFALWNREVDERLAEVLTGAYQRFAPEVLEERSSTASERLLHGAVVAGFGAAGGFTPLEREEFAWTDEVEVDRIVTRLATSSAHRLLDPAVADRLHEAIAEDLRAYGPLLELAYTTMVLSAERR